MTNVAQPQVPAPPLRRAWFRWVVCGLLLLVTANNYMDRQVLGVMAPELIREFGWSAGDYTEIVFWFQVAYGLGFLLAGPFFDWVGTRLGFAIAVAAWSLAATWHSGVSSLLGFKIVRFLLGLTEPSHMPGGIKVVAEWFPRSERALATGIFKGGSNLGAILVPLLVPWMYFELGWRATFLITASTGFGWLGLWLWLYRLPAESRHTDDEERRHIASDPAPTGEARPGWRALLGRRETWAYMNFKFMTDAIWHWYLAMLPLFLSQKFGLGLREFGLPLVAVYLIADVGSIGGGWLSWHWLKRGWDLTAARKTAMFICCVATLPVMAVAYTDNLWLAIGLIGLAHAAHQGLTSNLFSTVSDMFPRGAVGTVVGWGGTAGQVGAAGMTLLTALALEKTGSSALLFLVAGSTYVIAWIIFHFVVPRLEPLRFQSTE